MTTIWELDFYSRPILDENQKKIWEILICESPLTVTADPAALFRHAEYCPSSEVNSIRLKTAIETAIAKAGGRPDRIRFFRQAMNNMITKACGDLGLPSSLSRRTLALSRWLRDRQDTVYPQEPGYQQGTNPSVTFPAAPPQPLPEALMGDRWQFVTLAAQAFDEMPDWAIDFGEAFPLGLAGVEPDTPIPGLLIISERGLPLAAWMSGLELAAVSFAPDAPAKLLLETGINDCWTLATLAQADAQTEAAQFEAAKAAAQGTHFVAVQRDPDDEAFTGFWLLRTLDLA